MDGTVRSNPLLAVIDEILRLQSCFEDLFSEVSNASELSTLQKLVIFAVFDAPTPPTVPQIGRNLGHPRQVIQRVVNELVREGLLEKAPNPHHKRAMLLLPTEKADKMKRQAEERAFDTAEAFLGNFSARRCESLTGELKMLREALESYVQEKAEAVGQTGEPSPSISSALAFLERLS